MTMTHGLPDSNPTEEAEYAAAEASRGTNQTGVRAYNERLILSLIRRNTFMSKIEISKFTGLSAQTVSGIVNALEQSGLLLRDEPLRGRVGQPTVPFRLNPQGAFSLGLKIGRRSSDLILIDFVGEVQIRRKHTYTYPTPETVLNFVGTTLEWLRTTLPPEQLERIVGLGIASPFELWNWETEAGAPRDILDRWRSFDMQLEIAKICQWPVTFCNDASAACGAELIFGQGWKQQSFVYFFIGSFIGGGIVLDGNLYQGQTGYAGSIGVLPIAVPDGKGGFKYQQLLRHASTYVLENRLRASGINPSPIWLTPESWETFGEVLDQWVEETARNLAFAIVASVSIIDFDAAIIDGAIPLSVRQKLVQRTIENLAEFDLQGTANFRIYEGAVGAQARAIGGAALPFFENFARDRSVLFKYGVQREA